mgnify:CR=1 FL=1
MYQDSFSVQWPANLNRLPFLLPDQFLPTILDHYHNFKCLIIGSLRPFPTFEFTILVATRSKSTVELIIFFTLYEEYFQ